MKLFPLVLGCGLCLGVLAGCSKTDDSTPITSTTTTNPAPAAKDGGSSAVPAGWKTVEAKADNISMNVPADWSAIDLSTGDFNKAMEEASKNDPNVEQMKSTMQGLAANKSIKMMVIHPEKGSSFSPNINVIKTPSSGMAMDQIVKMNSEQLEKSYSTKATSETVKLAAGEATMLKWQMPQGANKLAMSTYLMLKNSDLYVITVSLPADAPDTLVKQTEDMVKSFDVKS